MPVASSTGPAAPARAEINDATTTAKPSRSSTAPTVAAPPSTAVGPASVNPTGNNVLLPSGNTTSNSTDPCRRILPNTRNSRPHSGCRSRVTVTNDGKSSIPAVRRGFL
jgi:hypothetical protein